MVKGDPTVSTRGYKSAGEKAKTHFIVEVEELALRSVGCGKVVEGR